MKPCPKHPKYKANKQPKSECTTCLSFYLAKKGKRIPTPKPGFSFKSIKDYSRNDKHKKPWREDE